MLNNNTKFVSIEEINKLKRMIKNLKLSDNKDMAEGDVMMSRKPVCVSCNQTVNMHNSGRDY